MADLILYTHPMSRGRVARWMLEETGAEYETVILQYETEMKAADYLAVNPMGKVPAIRHGDTVVTENAAICAYLADAFPAAGLAPPPADRSRGPYYRWLFFTAGPLEAAMTVQSMGFQVPPDRRRATGFGSFEDTVRAIGTAVPVRGYICGDRFTAADLYVSSFLDFATNMVGVIPRSSAADDYIARCTDRPAHRRAAKLDDSAIQAMQPPNRQKKRPGGFPSGLSVHR